MLSHRHAFEGIGTSWTIRTEHPLPAEVAAALSGRVEAFDRTYSRFRADSLVSAAARGPVTLDFPPDAVPLFDLYRRLYELTGGAVTPLVGDALEHWGYDAGYRLTPHAGRPAVPAWDDVMAWNGRRLTTAAPLVIDVGAAGKGYLVDLLAGLLVDAGIGSFLIDGSGDLRHRGPDVLRIGLEHPADQAKAIGVATLSGRALCASAGNRRRWAPGVHHVLDGRTGVGTSGVLATWAVADTALLADGLATALFFAEPELLAEAFDVEWVRMLAGGEIQQSTTFEGALFR